LLLPLTENQALIFECLSQFIQKNGYPPTQPELMELCHMNNVGSIAKCVSALEKKGYITRKKREHRGIRLTQEAEGKYLQ
tara:strand:+ start:8939 stop:9178 length:240 start_codon:yes stop_codon:yes gene_type:complete